jgi:hypothetical protein
MVVFLLSMSTMHRDGKRFPGVRWVVVITCVPIFFSTVIRRITPFSFVAVTLYMVAMLVSFPMELYSNYATGPGAAAPPSDPFVRLGFVAMAWCKYVL